MREQSAEEERRELPRRRIFDASDIALTPDETLIRSDWALVWRGLQTRRLSRARQADSIRVVLTTARLIFAPPVSLGVSARMYRWFLSWQGRGGILLLMYRRDVLLSHIVRVWHWVPEYSGNPMIQLTTIDPDPYCLELLDDDAGVLRAAPVEAVREHVEAIERAVSEAKERVPQAPDDPENRKLKTENHP